MNMKVYFNEWTKLVFQTTLNTAVKHRDEKDFKHVSQQNQGSHANCFLGQISVSAVCRALSSSMTTNIFVPFSLHVIQLSWL